MRLHKVLTLATVAAVLGTSAAAVYNAKCISNSDCHKIYNKEYECTEGSCMRHHFDFSPRESIGFVVVIIVSMLTNAGGVGAGTVIIPVFEVFYDFVSSDAIPLSRITIFAGSLVNYLLNWNLRDEKTGKYLIDYRLSSVIMPLLLAGTQVGVILSQFLPAVIVTGILVLYLVSSARQMFNRAVKDSAKETQALVTEENSTSESHEAPVPDNKKSEELPSTDQSKSELTDTNSTIVASQRVPTQESTTQISHQTTDISVADQSNLGLGSTNLLGSIKGQLNETKSSLIRLVTLHKTDLLSCTASLVLILFSAAIRGGEGKPSLIGLQTCSKSTGLVFLFTQILAVLFAVGNYYYNRSNFEEEDKGCDSQEEIIQRRKLRKQLLYACYITGILAGLLGVGGGMILNLYMLSLGMDPYLATALSTFIVLFSSGATTFQFLIAGAIHLRHAYMFMLLSLLGSLIGNLVLKAAIKKFRRPSILIWVLFFVLCIAVTVLPLEMVISVFRSHASALSFGRLC